MGCQIRLALATTLPGRRGRGLRMCRAQLAVVAVESVLLYSALWGKCVCTSIRRGLERVQPESFAGQPPAR